MKDDEHIKVLTKQQEVLIGIAFNDIERMTGTMLPYEITCDILADLVSNIIDSTK